MTSAPESRQPASLFLRMAALVYDGLLLIAIYFVAGALVTTPLLKAAAQHKNWVAVPEIYRHAVIMPTLALTTWLFFGFFWHRHGQTLGMQTWRIRIERQDGGTLGWKDALVRLLAAWLLPVLAGMAVNALHGPKAAISAFLCGVLANWLWMYGNPQRLALQDVLSRSRVWRVSDQSATGRSKKAA